MANRNILLILLAIIFLVNCTKDSNSESNYEFYINDRTKLAAEIVDESLLLKFNPPLNWSMQSAELSKKIESRNKGIDPTEKNFFYEPQYLFFNDSTGSLLSIGIIDYPDSTIQLNKKLNMYKNIVSNKYRAENLLIANFTKSKIQFSQFKFERGNFVNYKLVFANNANKIVLFDCTISKNNLQKELAFFKSCISSIENIKQN